ncbi:MAG: histidine phosphatase family protein [Candidatus Sulfotelmatobacter sp.]|jgi:alpha-ribazole phosphatase
MTSLLLIRHAETNMAGRFCGHSDPELNRRGRQQFAGLIDALSAHSIRRVYSSDLRRSRQTADAIAKHFGTELYLRPGLREINFGQWEGLSWKEIETRDPISAKTWVSEYPDSTAPGGEPFHEFVSRIDQEISFLLEEAGKLPIAVVTHAGFIRTVLTSRCGISQDEAWNRTKEYGSIVVLDASDVDRPKIQNFHSVSTDRLPSGA